MGRISGRIWIKSRMTTMKRKLFLLRTKKKSLRSARWDFFRALKVYCKCLINFLPQRPASKAASSDKPAKKAKPASKKSKKAVSDAEDIDD